MTYTKKTYIAGTKGNDEGNEYAGFYMAGHVKPEKTLNRAARLGVTVRTVEHCVFDMSGKGRSGHDGFWTFDGKTFTLLEETR